MRRIASCDDGSAPSLASEIRQPAFGGGLHAFLEIVGAALPLLLDQFAFGRALDAFGKTAPQSFAQRPGTQASSQANNQTGRKQNANIQPVPNGAKMKFKGVVIDRDADTFTIRDRNRTDYRVLLTDDSSIKTYGGFLRFGKKYAVTDILRGLIIEVEGRGDTQGQLVADKIRFNESDMRAAITTASSNQAFVFMAGDGCNHDASGPRQTKQGPLGAKHRGDVSTMSRRCTTRTPWIPRRLIRCPGSPREPIPSRSNLGGGRRRRSGGRRGLRGRGGGAGRGAARRTRRQGQDGGGHGGRGEGASMYLHAGGLLRLPCLANPTAS